MKSAADRSEYEVSSGTDTYKRRYTHGPGIDNPVKLPFEPGATDKDFTYFADALGSIRLLSDDDKETAISSTYTPYGETTTSIINDYAKVNPFTYTARELETASMLFYRSRFYTNRQGRFITKALFQSTFAHPLLLNNYLYIEGNSINAADPNGLFGVFHYSSPTRGVLHPNWPSGPIGYPFATMYSNIIRHDLNGNCVFDRLNFIYGFVPYAHCFFAFRFMNLDFIIRKINGSVQEFRYSFCDQNYMDINDSFMRQYIPSHCDHTFPFSITTNWDVHTSFNFEFWGHDLAFRPGIKAI